MDSAHNHTACVVKYHATHNGSKGSFDNLGTPGISPDDVNEATTPPLTPPYAPAKSVQ